MSKLKILFYQLDLNEAFYGTYSINGLRKLGHNVIELPRDSSGHVDASKILDIKWYKEQSFDLIFYMGFSLSNQISHQMMSKFIPQELDIPFVVTFYDNPCRYLANLKHLLGTKYTFFICDSELVEKMKGHGFENTHYAPCMVDPTINRKTPTNVDMEHNIVFPGTVIDYNTLYKNRRGKNFAEMQILNDWYDLRERGKYFRYDDYLISRGIDPFSHDFGNMCFNMIMEQKYLLRIELFKAILETGQGLHLYGQGDWRPESDSIFIHGNLHQHTQLPQLYSSSKIITSVEMLPSSVHQRLFETSACGGFSMFEDKADNDKCYEGYISWTSLDDFKEKARYYLENEDERNKIAKSLQEQTLDKHTNVIRMQQILDILGL